MNRAVAVVAEQLVLPAEVRGVEVRIAVVVVVAEDDALDVLADLDPGGRGDVGEPAVAVVAVELAGRVELLPRIRRVVGIGTVLVADVEVEVAVVVGVAPGGGLRRTTMLGQPARGEGDVGEPPGAVVAQQRPGVASRPPQPGAAQDVDVEVAVVVEVGLHQVEPAEEAGQPAGLGAVDQRAAVVAEVGGIAAGIHRGGEEIEVAVAVEVVEDGAARQAPGADAEARRDVLERGKRLLRREHRRRHAIAFRHSLRVVAQRHVREVGEPHRLDEERRALRHALEDLLEVVDGLPRPFGSA